MRFLPPTETAVRADGVKVVRVHYQCNKCERALTRELKPNAWGWDSLA
jgi:hypothetical protein